MMIGGSCYMWLLNIKEVLVKCCLRLQKTKNLNFGDPFESKLFLYLVGDKGGKTTKIRHPPMFLSLQKLICCAPMWLVSFAVIDIGQLSISSQ
uniref:Uncharacterized protein n=1 Tax=Ditylenchus dipsaci TaxID=166011 RepID=A0A915E100_9BILA